MKILMFGRGVIASLYGWALERAGHSMDFYVRPGRAAEYGPTLALKFLDARTRLRGAPVEETWKVRLREDLPVDHDYELIAVSVQHERFAEVAAFLGLQITFKLIDPLRVVLESHTNPHELTRICRDVLVEARRLGVAVPRLEALEAFFPEEPDSK